MSGKRGQLGTSATVSSHGTRRRAMPQIARTRGKLKIIRADGTTEFVGKVEADRDAHATVRANHKQMGANYLDT